MRRAKSIINYNAAVMYNLETLKKLQVLTVMYCNIWPRVITFLD